MFKDNFSCCYCKIATYQYAYMYLLVYAIYVIVLRSGFLRGLSIRSCHSAASLSLTTSLNNVPLLYSWWFVTLPKLEIIVNSFRCSLIKQQ